MKDFYNSFTFILAFLILTLIINMIFGATVTEKFLLLVLLSMVVVNSDAVVSIFSKLTPVE